MIYEYICEFCYKRSENWFVHWSDKNIIKCPYCGSEDCRKFICPVALKDVH